jgi:hypothetical protein
MQNHFRFLSIAVFRTLRHSNCNFFASNAASQRGKPVVAALSSRYVVYIIKTAVDMSSSDLCSFSIHTNKSKRTIENSLKIRKFPPDMIHTRFVECT